MSGLNKTVFYHTTVTTLNASFKTKHQKPRLIRKQLKRNIHNLAEF